MKKKILISLIMLLTAGVKFSAAFQANVAPVALDVKIMGEARSGLTLYGTYYYFDADDDPQDVSVFQWYRSDYNNGSSVETIAGANSDSYKLTDSDIGKYIMFSVKPVAQSGTNSNTLYYSGWTSKVVNDPPAAASVSITGSKMVNDALVGNYVYTDTEGDQESGSVFQWYSSDTLTGSYNAISGEILKAHVIKMDEQGKYFRFGVIPKALTGNNNLTEFLSLPFGPANSMPVVDNAIPGGIPEVDQTLIANYQYFDADTDAEGNSLFQWYRGSDAIPGANSSTYVLTSDDAGTRISFKITPVSATGYPDTGNPVISDSTAVVTDPGANLPEATQICISGKRDVGEELTGKYLYVDKYKEKGSEYFWYNDNKVIQHGDSPDSMNYILKPGDIDHMIRFAVIPRNKNGTSGSLTFSEPFAYFTLPRENFSATDPDIVLTATPGGGIFWGENVTNGVFSPSDADSTKSLFTVFYQVTIKNPKTECQQTTSEELTVSPIQMYFTSFRDIYCQNGGIDTIHVENIPSGSTSLQFRMTDPGAIVDIPDATTIIIDPGRMRAGSRRDTIFFQAVYGQSLLRIFRTFEIDTVTTVSILNLPPQSEYCNNLAPFELLVSHPGGYFEGPVDGNIFYPSMAIGDTTVKYTYTTNRGCTSTVTVPVTINPSPEVSFTLKDVCIENSADTTNFINETISADPVKKWLWEFIEERDTIVSTNKNPGYLYTKGGFHKVILTSTTINECSAALDTLIDLGVKPIAGFYWQNECFHPSDSLWLFDSTIFSSPIVSRTWNFHDGNLLTEKDPKYPKKATGYLPVEYIVRTAYPGCHDTVEKNIFIRPTIAISSDDYFENFENGNGGWVRDYEKQNNWSFGKPDRNFINSAASGDSAWYTAFPFTGQTKESSSIISPCFDFTSVKRPMISLKIWKRFDHNRDGAALQYTIKDSGKWERVGTLDDGINWYNSALISGKPGGDNLGWTSNGEADDSWVDARHRLDELEGLKDVKLRIAYGSDGTSRDDDGIAFDDVRIGPRTRGVLLEHFTNISSVAANEATNKVSGIALMDTADVINIQYHTNFPGTDPFYDANPGDASGRFLFYGLAGVPYSFIDGGTENEFANIFDYKEPESEIDSTDIAKRSLIYPSFGIDLQSEVNGGVLTVSGKIKAMQDVKPANDSANVTLYLAVTEKRTGGFNNVFRKFIPDAGGILLPKEWNKDQEYTIAPASWIIENIADNADIEVIAFLQNNITKEVYQAVSNIETASAAGTKKDLIPDLKKFGIYPNPAYSRLTVAFEEETEPGTDIKIFDFSGSLVRSYITGAGAREYDIENLGLKNGIYLVKIYVNGINRGYRKLIVSGN